MDWPATASTSLSLTPSEVVHCNLLDYSSA